ncbi:MAG: CoA ester lyase [Novosphingobium sp.]
MRYRSWLYVPGDSERKLGKALATGSDVVVVDLDAAAPGDGKQAARANAAEWLAAHRHHVLEQAPISRWVRINSLDSRLWRDDLVAVLPGAPEGIILPRAVGPDALRQIAAELYELEQANRLVAGSTKLIPVVGETARAALTIAAYADAAMPRLGGLAWGAEGLAEALSATRQYEQKAGWSEPFRFVRAQTLLTAHACGVMALEAMHADAADIKGLKLAARAARADGFTGMIANHPAQVAEINAAFTPSDSDLEQARQIVASFEDSADEAVPQVDRRRIDTPQLKFAKQILGSGPEPRSAELTPMRMFRAT